MNKNWLLYTGIVLFVFGVVSCADNKLLKTQGEARRAVGEAYMNQNDYTASLNELLESEKLYPNDPHLHNDLGLVYMAKDRLQLAVDHFKKAVELKPDYAPAINNLGTAYLALKDWDSAIVCFDKVYKNLLYATPHYSLSNLGWAYYNKKEYSLAEKYYKEALKLDTNFPIALHGLGITYLKTGNISEAVIYLEKAIKYSPWYPERYMDLSEAYIKLKQYDKAIGCYYKVIEISPDNDLSAQAQKEISRLKADKHE
ncbi:MAG: tetratricopeptide repeat protein [Desulfobacterium sp.]|nr:tetratricopeptide repeat protein [Desulfobacterium sp.]MBU3949319.1 tetratricopeptide repeat protein [Pseudomonadota bacterium]